MLYFIDNVSKKCAVYSISIYRKCYICGQNIRKYNYICTKLNAGLYKIAYVSISSISIQQCAFVGLHTNRKCIRARIARNSIRDGHTREVNAFLRNDIGNIEIVGISIFLGSGVGCTVFTRTVDRTKETAARIKHRRRSQDNERERIILMQFDFTRDANSVILYFNISKTFYNSDAL